jgi:hypothetical protein
MAEALDPGSIAEQVGQQGQELLERSQVMIADMLRGYLGQFQVRAWVMLSTLSHGALGSSACCCVVLLSLSTCMGTCFDQQLTLGTPGL